MKLFQKYTGYLRSLRLGYWLYNITHYKKLHANAERYKKLGIKKKVWQSVAHADIAKPALEKPWLDAPSISTTSIQNKKGFDQFDNRIQQKIIDWPSCGYIILENFFTPAEVDATNEAIDTLLAKQKVDFNFTGRKIMDAWKESEAVSYLFKHEKLQQILSFLLGKDVIPFQTINFQKGSEQRPHSDSIHMTTEPLGYLIATWTALEDVTDGAGQLVYYPGSHKLDYVMGEDYDTGNKLWALGADNYPNYEEKIAEVIAKHQLKPHYFMAKKGDVLIWHANLLHGGSTIKDSNSTRKSQVAHYFAKDVLCYHEISQRPALLPM